MNSLKNAGAEQQKLYDFSFSEDNKADQPIQEGDMAMVALLPHEIDSVKEDSMVVYLKHVT